MQRKELGVAVITKLWMIMRKKEKQEEKEKQEPGGGLEVLNRTSI